jgi:hypothetical protein
MHFTVKSKCVQVSAKTTLAPEPSHKKISFTGTSGSARSGKAERLCPDRGPADAQVAVIQL